MGRKRYRDRHQANPRQRPIMVAEKDPRAGQWTGPIITLDDRAGHRIVLHPSRYELTIDREYVDVTRSNDTPREYLVSGRKFVITAWE